MSPFSRAKIVEKIISGFAVNTLCAHIEQLLLLASRSSWFIFCSLKIVNFFQLHLNARGDVKAFKQCEKRQIYWDRERWGRRRNREWEKNGSGRNRRKQRCNEWERKKWRKRRKKRFQRLYKNVLHWSSFIHGIHLFMALHKPLKTHKQVKWKT